MLEIGRRVPAGCCVLGGQRDLTLARWAVAVSLGCCAERNQAAKPQVSLLPDPLRCWCGTADPEAEEHVYIKVKRFFLSHQYLDLRKVPGFFQLFYSFDSEYKTA
ncbi:uncharacterized protein LOC110475109 isoform X2 [Lonchura striata]